MSLSVNPKFLDAYFFAAFSIIALYYYLTGAIIPAWVAIPFFLEVVIRLIVFSSSFLKNKIQILNAHPKTEIFSFLVVFGSFFVDLFFLCFVLLILATFSKSFIAEPEKTNFFSLETFFAAIITIYRNARSRRLEAAKKPDKIRNYENYTGNLVKSLGLAAIYACSLVLPFSLFIAYLFVALFSYAEQSGIMEGFYQDLTTYEENKPPVRMREEKK